MSSSHGGGGGGGPAKKLVIQIKSKPSLPPNYFPDTWAHLALALDSVRHHQPSPTGHGFSELYAFVENLCLHKLGPQTYAALYKDVDQSVSSSLQQHWDNTRALAANQFLQQFARFWHDYTAVMRATRLIFTVLDRNSAKTLQPQPDLAVPGSRSLWDMGLQLFKRHLLLVPELLEKLVGDLLVVIERERLEGGGGGEDDHSASYHDVLRMFFNLSMYASHFEPRFLQATQDFYRAESSALLTTGECTVADYLSKAERRLAEENRRGSDFFDLATRKALRRSVEDCLVTAHATVLVERGLDQFLQDQRVDDLQRMYALFEVVHLHDTLLLQHFALNSRARGMAIVGSTTATTGAAAAAGDESSSTASDKTDLVSRLLELKRQLDEVCAQSFCGNELFVRAVKTSFEQFLNSGEDNRPAELIAKYIDRTLRSTTSTSQIELEHSLVSSMTLFRFLHAKDVFEEFYKQCLAKRLLLGTSNSPDLERTMIANLKTECGSSFTSKLEGMMRDVEQSRATSQQFVAASTSGATSATAKVESQVQVLSMGFWPTFPDSPCTLPLELEEEKDRFAKFYAGKHEGRVLHWVNSLGRCTVRFVMEPAAAAGGGGGRWDLDVSLFQAVVLLQFNDNSNSKGSSKSSKSSKQQQQLLLPRSLTYKQLAEATNITHEELVKTLSSLALGRKDQRVLVRSSKGTQSIFPEDGGSSSTGGGEEEEEEDGAAAAAGASSAASSGGGVTLASLCHLDDVFHVNLAWTSKRTRLKINQIQIKETKKENDDAHKRVQGDRQYQIDAAIVRIMKTRKQLSHSLLVTELFKQLSFPAKPQDLKKRIESLIDRDYLERDESDANVYVYVA